jgi:hypothetical protein
MTGGDAADQHLQRGVDYKIDAQKRIVYARFGRKVTFADIAHYARTLKQSADFNSEYSEIADLTAVEQLELQADDFLKLADQVDPFSHQAKRAFVTANSVQDHAARMHRLLLSSKKFGIFRSIADAERWIASSINSEP